MGTIPRPTEVKTLAELAEPLDAADHATRLEWIYSLGGKQQYALYALAQGSPVTVEELVRGPGVVVRHYGKNGLLLFNRFEKRFVRSPDGVVGYNHSDVNAIVRPLYGWVTGPGHFVAYDSPEVPGEVWIDYRKVGTTQVPEFPPLRSNERGLPALIFGDMVDVLRRVSRKVFIGDSFKGKYPRPDKAPLLARIGGLGPTAPFVLCQEE
jgi:hypothetical protein